MRTSTLLAAPVLCLALLATGCGGEQGRDSEDGPTPTPTQTASATPSVTPTPTPTRPRPTRSAPTVAPEGDGDADDDGRPATEGGGICADLEPADVGRVLGGTVTGEALPGGGCAFTQRKPSAPAATIVETSFAASPGGMDGAKVTATSTVEGTPIDLRGIGDAAFVVTGTSFGGDQLQGGGAVVIGDRLVGVTFAQSAGLPRAKVRALVVALLTEIADELA